MGMSWLLFMKLFMRLIFGSNWGLWGTWGWGHFFQANVYQRQGNQLRRKMWLQNMKVKLIVLAIIIAIALIIWLSICRGFVCHWNQWSWAPTIRFLLPYNLNWWQPMQHCTVWSLFQWFPSSYTLLFFFQSPKGREYLFIVYISELFL